MKEKVVISGREIHKKILKQLYEINTFRVSESTKY
jgi:hypothetical protein